METVSPAPGTITVGQQLVATRVWVHITLEAPNGLLTVLVEPGPGLRQVAEGIIKMCDAGQVIIGREGQMNGGHGLLKP